MSLHRVGKPVHSMCEHPHCPRCGQPILVAEVDNYNQMIARPVEQEIVCPQCSGFIATLMSYRKVFTYKAPVGDYVDEVEVSEDPPS